MRTRRLGRLLAVLLTLGLCLSVIMQIGTAFASPPTDNPVQTHYGPSAYPWTNAINWGVVKDVTSYPGPTDMDKYMQARADVVAAGGGVVYFPAGDYYFKDDLELTKGVVIRGDMPTAACDSKSGTNIWPTRFHFPKYSPNFSGSGTPNNTAFKKIVTQNPDTDSNIGVVFIDINRAGIELIGDPDTGTNHNIVVFGNRQNNVADPISGIPTSFQNAWQRWSDPETANMEVQAFENAIIACNRLNDKVTDDFIQPGYIVQDIVTSLIITYPTGQEAKFSYTDHHGIKLNRSKPFYVPAADIATEPSLFRKGLTVRDNWILHTMKSGIKASGAGLEILANDVLDKKKKPKWVDLKGAYQVNATYKHGNQGINWSGVKVAVHKNRYEVFPQYLLGTTLAANDVEGIIMKKNDGGTVGNAANIQGNSGNAYIGVLQSKHSKHIEIIGNTVTGGTDAAGNAAVVNVNDGITPYNLQYIRIDRNKLEGHISMIGSAGAGVGNTIQRNSAITPTKQVFHSCAAAAAIGGNVGYVVTPCLP